uniref:tRNA-splicing endonuclease subunit Sen54 N-terminal domain-containing protein n=1 Tax=Nelumbo nucifera TaxID=4432 RepID=A0A822ZMZ7_NELNU|nr:TPA_asm: hypothetical protein HUJ06_003131 [Nelumbo nucifera]
MTITLIEESFATHTDGLSVLETKQIRPITGIVEIEDLTSSSDGMSDLEVTSEELNDEELQYTSGSIPKLQFRKDTSKARWNAEMGMAKVIEKNGKMWITIGIVRRGKLYCTIEETLFLAEIGAHHLLDVGDTTLFLKDLYEKVAEGKSGCCWETFKVYRHLKSLGYIVGRYGVPWTMKSNNGCNSALQGTTKTSAVSDIYLPNSKFRKSPPGDPSFMLYVTRAYPPSRNEIEELERKCNGIPLKFSHVDHG